MPCLCSVFWSGVVISVVSRFKFRLSRTCSWGYSMDALGFSLMVTSLKEWNPACMMLPEGEAESVTGFSLESGSWDSLEFFVAIDSPYELERL